MPHTSPHLSPIPPQAPPPLAGWPLLRLGFRPFYLLTALLAGISVPVWMAAFLGYMPLQLPLSGLLWHGHEMLFGFAVGVIAGFLLTAVKAWTGHMTARGPLLAALVLLWLAGRIAAVCAPYTVFAVVDMLFLPAVAVVLLRVLFKSGNTRNIPLISLLLLMSVANLCFHLTQLNLVDWDPLRPLYAELGLILMVVSVMTGRVVPMFTRNVTPGLVINTSRSFELGLLAVTGVTLMLWVGAAPAALVAAACAITAVLHAIRLYRWSPWVTLKRPILWILHLSYLWMPIGFAMLAGAELGWMRTTFAIHALTVGVIGGLIIGMLTRTARGHTGRPLQASRGETVAYALVLLATVIRAVVPALVPAWYPRAIEISATFWALAFAIYLVIYTPWLLRSRLDGKDG